MLVAAGGPSLVWWVAPRPRFVVSVYGVVIVGHFTRRFIPWDHIRRFGNEVGLVVEARDCAHPVALDNATLKHLRGRRDQADELAAELNRFLAQRNGGVQTQTRSVSIPLRDGQ